jgi:hypothetical protein
MWLKHSFGNWEIGCANSKEYKLTIYGHFLYQIMMNNKRYSSVIVPTNKR